MDPFPRKKEPGSFFQTPSIHFPTSLDKLQHACNASTVPGGSGGPGRPVTVLSRGSKNLRQNITGLENALLGNSWSSVSAQLHTRLRLRPAKT